ncbi:MAG: hypothetical protein KAX36_00515, partial [Thermoflexales bacterium]|nr:hypothetical protein [Thermoflexales bacterium]
MTTFLVWKSPFLRCILAHKRKKAVPKATASAIPSEKSGLRDFYVEGERSIVTYFLIVPARSGNQAFMRNGTHNAIW